MCKIIPFPSADLRRAIRSRRLRHVLEIAKREGFVHLSASERQLILDFRKCSPADRQFVARTAAALRSAPPINDPAKPAKEQ